MNGILGTTELVLATKLEPDQRELLEISRASGESLLALLNDILDLSKIEADRMDLILAPFDVRTCVLEAMRTSSMEARARALKIEAMVSEDVPAALTGDPIRLRQVLLNLIGNAMKFTEEGWVQVRVRRSGGDEERAELEFVVEDTGAGVPEHSKEVIFEAFRQADGSATRKHGGTGLGLAICRRLVTLMDGRIWVESKEGEGSRFYFTAWFGKASTDGAAGGPVQIWPPQGSVKTS